jgi:antitoxin ParD1/3/4
MAPTKALISVQLGAKQQAILNRQLATGHYENASEVLQDALLALDKRDAVYDEWLRERVRASMANKKPNIAAEAAFERIEARHARKVKAAKRGA